MRGDDDNEDDGGIAGGGAGIPTGNTVGEEVYNAWRALTTFIRNLCFILK